MARAQSAGPVYQSAAVVYHSSPKQHHSFILSHLRSVTDGSQMQSRPAVRGCTTPVVSTADTAHATDSPSSAMA